MSKAYKMQRCFMFSTADRVFHVNALFSKYMKEKYGAVCYTKSHMVDFVREIMGFHRVDEMEEDARACEVMANENIRIENNAIANLCVIDRDFLFDTDNMNVFELQYKADKIADEIFSLQMESDAYIDYDEIFSLEKEYDELMKRIWE